MTVPQDLTVVADVGARYGIHPSFRRYGGPLRYIAFEPDAEEAERLRGIYTATPQLKYEVSETALDKQSGTRDFYLLRHRGLSSFLKPDLNSECFRHLKPGQAEIDRIIQIRTDRLDEVFGRMAVVPDFIKIDTEGTEQDVLEGGEALLDRTVLGIRLSCNFQPCFIGQRLFSESHEYLLKRDYMLLNIDYKGFGYPRLGLFRKPDPVENEDFRYGILVAADAVWIRNPAVLPRTFSGAALGIATIKLACFCLLNNAPDLAVDLLRESTAADHLTADIRNLRLARSLQIQVARFLGRWRTVPDEQWEKARSLFSAIYGEPLRGGADFYPQIDRMSRALKEMDA